jgi:hypothetical protein
VNIEIKGKTYNGSVRIFDRLTLPQVEAIEAAIYDVPEVVDGRVKLTTLDKPRIPALLVCVESWNISGFPEPLSIDNFPLSPRRETHNIIDRIFSEVANVYNGEQEIPNE